VGPRIQNGSQKQKQKQSRASQLELLRYPTLQQRRRVRSTTTSESRTVRRLLLSHIRTKTRDERSLQSSRCLASCTAGSLTLVRHNTVGAMYWPSDVRKNVKLTSAPPRKYETNSKPTGKCQIPKMSLMPQALRRER